MSWAWSNPSLSDHGTGLIDLRSMSLLPSCRCQLEAPYPGCARSSPRVLASVSARAARCTGWTIHESAGALGIDWQPASSLMSGGMSDEFGAAAQSYRMTTNHRPIARGRTT